MLRALHLYGIWWLSLVHRLRHELGRELTVLAASAVMFATFFYVFNDFLNVQVASVALNMRASFARAVTIVIILLATVAASRYERREATATATVGGMARHLGERRSARRAYRVLRGLTIVAAWHGSAWYLIGRWLQPWSLGSWCVTEAAMLLATAFLTHLPNAAAPHAVEDHSAAAPQPQRGKVFTLVSWRLTQILRRSRLTQACLLLAGGFLALVLLAAVQRAPLFVPMVAGLGAGYMVAASLCCQLSDDLSHAWLERGVGVSHAEFIGAYTNLGRLLGAAVATFAAVCMLAGNLALPTWATVAAAAKLGAVSAVPCLSAPPLLLQIDGRRLAITLLLTLIASLFIGTAVFAHWLGLALVPLLSVTAGPAQAGRFYRA